MRWESEKDIGRATVEKIFTTLLAPALQDLQQALAVGDSQTQAAEIVLWGLVKHSH
jgi:hypothetical protein